MIFKLQYSDMIEIKQTKTFNKWERKLKDEKARAAIAARIFRLSCGLEGDVAPIGEGLSELRIHYGPGYRVYYKQKGTQLILLICGGNKSTQKKDIALAKKIAKELEI